MHELANMGAISRNKNTGGDIDLKIDLTSEDVKIPSELAVR
jgi:hypothetical protein